MKPARRPPEPRTSRTSPSRPPPDSRVLGGPPAPAAGGPPPFASWSTRLSASLNGWRARLRGRTRSLTPAGQPSATTGAWAAPTPCESAALPDLRDLAAGPSRGRLPAGHRVRHAHVRRDHHRAQRWQLGDRLGGASGMERLRPPRPPGLRRAHSGGSRLGPDLASRASTLSWSMPLPPGVAVISGTRGAAGTA